MRPKAETLVGPKEPLKALVCSLGGHWSTFNILPSNIQAQVQTTLSWNSKIKRKYMEKPKGLFKFYTFIVIFQVRQAFQPCAETSVSVQKKIIHSNLNYSSDVDIVLPPCVVSFY